MSGDLRIRVSPCLRCTRVRDPRNCENKNCQVWRAWFLKSWEQTRLLVRERTMRATLIPDGVRIGGRWYSPPHKLREYLAEDPCDKCAMPKNLCATACQSKRAWLQAKGDVVP